MIKILKKEVKMMIIIPIADIALKIEPIIEGSLCPFITLLILCSSNFLDSLIPKLIILSCLIKCSYFRGLVNFDKHFRNASKKYALSPK